MNRDEIINMAREAGFTDWWINPPEPERKGMCYGMLARLVAWGGQDVGVMVV